MLGDVPETAIPHTWLALLLARVAPSVSLSDRGVFTPDVEAKYASTVTA